MVEFTKYNGLIYIKDLPAYIYNSSTNKQMSQQQIRIQAACCLRQFLDRDTTGVVLQQLENELRKDAERKHAALMKPTLAAINEWADQCFYDSYEDTLYVDFHDEMPTIGNKMYEYDEAVSAKYFAKLDGYRQSIAAIPEINEWLKTEYVA